MAGEIVPGKRTTIARAGHEDFDLPDGPEISVGRDDEGNVSTATLRWGDRCASVFTASTVERDDAVVVHLGDYFGSTGYGTIGEGSALPQVLPYRFPDDDRSESDRGC